MSSPGCLSFSITCTATLSPRPLPQNSSLPSCDLDGSVPPQATPPAHNPALGLLCTMVRIHEEGAFRVFVYAPPREHRPPHVHVECAHGGEVVVRIGGQGTAPPLWLITI